MCVMPLPLVCPEKPQTSDPPVRNQMTQLECTTHRKRLWLDPEGIRGSYYVYSIVCQAS